MAMPGFSVELLGSLPKRARAGTVVAPPADHVPLFRNSVYDFFVYFNHTRLSELCGEHCRPYHITVNVQ